MNKNMLVMLLIGVFGFGHVIAQNQVLSSLFLGIISLTLFILVKENT